MKLTKSLVALLSIGVVAAISGCGKDAIESGSVPQTAAFNKSQACFSCHATKVSSVTGAQIVDEWKASAHNTRNGAACTDCHTTNGHPTSGAVPDIPLDAVCVTCHTSSTMKTYAAHFDGGTTFDATKAAYVTPNDVNGCRVCHNPHDMTTLMRINKQWAESKHGKTDEPAWAEASHRWKAPGNAACQRCHTSTGYRSYMTTGLTVPGSKFFGSYTTGREVAGCKTCHLDYSWKRLTASPSFAVFSTPYKTPSGIARTYPTTLGDSRLCIPCHSGRESGESVKAISSFTNVSFKNSHYLGAAGSFYQKIGFHYYTSAAKMTNSWSHGNLGINNYVTSGGIATGNNGPCVTCHIGKDTHTFDPIEVAKTTGATGCYGCHAGEDMATLNEEERSLFDRGMDFFSYNMNQTGIYYSLNYPYFYVSQAAADAGTQAQALKNWTIVGPTTGAMVGGANTMGAAFNYNMLNREKGAHVHNRTYARRLIFDSIQYLQKGAVSYSTSTSPAVGGTTDPNSQVSFTAYSTAKPTGTVSISQLKTWLLRSSGGKYYRR